MKVELLILFLLLFFLNAELLFELATNRKGEITHCLASLSDGMRLVTSHLTILIDPTFK